MLPRGGFADVLDQAHLHSAPGADGLEARQCGLVAVDGGLQLGAGVAQVMRIEEDGGDARVDECGFECAYTGYVQIVHKIAGGEHRATIFALISRVDELQLHLGSREGHTVQLEIPRLLHLAFGDGHMRHDGLADVGLPDPHGAYTVVRHAGGVHQAVGDGERAHRC